MKKYVKITVITLMLVSFSCIALAEKITVQHEVSQEKQQDNSVTTNVVKENRLSSKRIKDKMDANSVEFKGKSNERMMRYRQFNDGDGKVKNKK